MSNRIKGKKTKKFKHVFTWVILFKIPKFSFLVLAPTIAYCSLFNIGTVILRPDKYNILTLLANTLSLIGTMFDWNWNYKDRLICKEIYWIHPIDQSKKLLELRPNLCRDFYLKTNIYCGHLSYLTYYC